MKLFIVLFAVVALAAAESEYVRAVPYEQAQETSARTGLRIANGHAAAENQFPHQVSVTTPVGGGVSACGGSLISSSWVFTAAHCTQGTQVNIRIGSINKWSGGIAQTSFRMINHAGYNPINLNNDVSLVALPTPVGYNAAVQAVRLPTTGQTGTTFEGFQSTVSGWGATGPNTGVQTMLRWVLMRVIPNSQCVASYGPSVIVGHVVCALGYVNAANQGHCGGDSGGPLIINEGGVDTQIGVVSFGSAQGCHLGFPSGYMRTASFTGWVASQTGIPVRA